MHEGSGYSASLRVVKEQLLTSAPMFIAVLAQDIANIKLLSLYIVAIKLRCVWEPLMVHVVGVTSDV